jgi:hypothetical protein
MTDQTATEATESATWQQHIAQAIGPTMLFGLQDAELFDEPGKQRVQEWVDWISKTVAVLRDKELEQARAEVAAARKFAADMRDFASPHGVAVDYADRLTEAMDRAKEGR